MDGRTTPGSEKLDHAQFEGSRYSAHDDFFLLSEESDQGHGIVGVARAGEVEVLDG